jgi:hypothetical protein
MRLRFELIDRLLWLAMTIAAVTAVVIAGLFALLIDVDSERVMVIAIGGLAAIILVMWVGVFTRLRSARRQRQEVRPEPAPWFAGSPDAPSPAGSADVITLPHRSQPGAEMAATPASGVPLEPLADTRPMHRVQVEEPPADALEDTHPRQAFRPPSALKPAARSPYDDLFPPPQPDDDDYLECDHDSTPILFIPAHGPPVIDRPPETPADQVGDQTAKPGDEPPAPDDS